MAVDVSSGTTLDQCPILYLLLAWRDLVVVLASSKVRITEFCLKGSLPLVDNLFMHLISNLSPHWFYLSGTGLPSFSRKRGR